MGTATICLFRHWTGVSFSRLSIGCTMWYLEFLTSSPIQEHTFPMRFWIGGVNAGVKSLGRKSNIRLTCPNASRLHATLLVEAEGDTEYLTLTDQSSHGTFVIRADSVSDSQNPRQEERVDKASPVRLTPGDRVAFGRPGAWYVVGRENFVIFADKLPEKEHCLLKETCDKVGLTLTGTWNEQVSFLLCDELTASPWLCLALLRGIPVVHVAWVERVKEIVLNSAEQVGLITVPDLAASYTQLPPTDSYFPRRSDVFKNEEIASIAPIDNHRRQLFCNKKFWILLEEEAKGWEAVVVDAGGQVVRDQEADYVVAWNNRNTASVPSRKVVSPYQITLALLQVDAQVLEKRDMKEAKEEEVISTPLKYAIDSDAETDDEGKDSKDVNLDGDWKGDEKQPQMSKNHALLPCGVWLNTKRKRSETLEDEKTTYNSISFIQVSYPTTTTTLASLNASTRPKRTSPTISCTEMQAYNKVG